MARRKKKSAIKIKPKAKNDTVGSSGSQPQQPNNSKKIKQTKDERLEKKRNAERKRLEKIRNDPVRYAEFKEKQRLSYHKRKAEKKILPVSEMSARDRKIVRKRNRDNFKNYYYKKKERARLEVILQENSPPDSDADDMDPALVIENQNLNIAGPSQPNRESPQAASTLAAYRPCHTSMSPKSTASICSSIGTSASTSVHKAALYRYKYEKKKEIMALEKKITKLERIKDAYRKKCERLQQNSRRSIGKGDTNLTKVPKNRSQKYNIALSALKKDVIRFFEEDEVSRVCPGKKEYITRKKDKKQKRYLNDSMKNLYERYISESVHQTVSYTTFCRFRPFWVRIPNINARETCLCKLHANVELLVTALKRRNIVSENSCTDICQSLCCASNNVQCLLRKCKECKHKSLEIKEFDDSEPITYWQWQASPKTIDKRGVERKVIITEKVKINSSPRAAINELVKLITPFLEHCGIIVNQSAAVKNFKNNLSKEECILHIDFSENYSIKFGKEIQALHFGGNRSQITLHTAVLYYFDQSCAEEDKYKTQAIGTFSTCLRHDAAAIWAHLIPLLEFIQEKAPQVNVLHFLSDSPSSQYRNKKTFYIMAKLHWQFPNLEKLTWNYSESGHGKGAPDGVGGLLKRTADQTVAYGHDISNLEDLMQHLRSNVTGVQMVIVDDYAIYEKDLLIPDTYIQPFRGTMKTHQVVWNKEQGNRLAMRMRTCDKKECFSNAAVICAHGTHIAFHDVEKPVNSTAAITRSAGRQPTVTKNMMTFPIAKSCKKGMSNKQSIKVLSQKTIKPPVVANLTIMLNEDYPDSAVDPVCENQSIEDSSLLDANIRLDTPTMSEIGSLANYLNDNESLTSLNIPDLNSDVFPSRFEDPLTEHNHLNVNEHPIRDITNIISIGLDTAASKSPPVTMDSSPTRSMKNNNMNCITELQTTNANDVSPNLQSVNEDKKDLNENTHIVTGPKIGDYILATFAANRGKTTFMYVCLIKEMYDDGKLLIQGYKSVKKNKKVFRPIPKDISIIDVADIECILPPPRATEHETLFFSNIVNVKEM